MIPRTVEDKQTNSVTEGRHDSEEEKVSSGNLEIPLKDGTQHDNGSLKMYHGFNWIV